MESNAHKKENQKPFWPRLEFSPAEMKRMDEAHKLLKEEQALIDKACAERMEQWRKDKATK
jgi:hypothetical protein